jgi:HlyD family secretion protein
MAKRHLRVLIPIIVLVLAGGGIALWLVLRSEKPTDVLVLYGNVDIRQVELAFNGNERIDSICVKEGDQVREGDLLATLQKERLKLAVANAAAKFEAQKQTVAALDAGSRPEEIRKAQAEKSLAETRASNAQRQYERTLELWEQKGAGDQELDDAKAASRTAKDALDSAEQSLALVLAGPRKEDIAAAKATLAGLDAELGLARQNLADAELHAPCAGIIQDRILEPGDMASPQRPVLTMAIARPLWVRTYLPGPMLGRVREGMGATVTTDSFPGKEYDAWVGYISPTAEFTPRSVQTEEVRSSLVYQVRIFVPDPAGELRLGMPATVTIRLNQPAPAASRPATRAVPRD